MPRGTANSSRKISSETGLFSSLSVLLWIGCAGPCFSPPTERTAQDAKAELAQKPTAVTGGPETFPSVRGLEVRVFRALAVPVRLDDPCAKDGFTLASGNNAFTKRAIRVLVARAEFEGIDSRPAVTGYSVE